MKKSKFNNIYTAVDGIKFHSKLEASFYKTIKKAIALNSAVNLLRLQVPFIISRDGKKKYIADFVIFTKNNVYVIECKGYQTDVSKLKMKLFVLLYPDIKLFIGSDISKLVLFLKGIY